MSKTVKNITESELSLPNIGVVAAGETVTVPDDFHNPNFEVVKSGKDAASSEKKKEDDAAPNAPKTEKKGDKK